MPETMTLGLEEPAPLRGDPGYQLDVGGVISRTFSVTFSNLPSFLLVGVLVYSPALLLHGLGAVFANQAVLLSLIANLMESLLGIVLAGALTFGVIRALRGDKASVGEIAEAGASSLGRVLVVSLLVGIMTLIGALLCIVPGVIVACMNWVAVPVTVMERPGIRASLDRSHELTSGTRLGVFAVLLVVALIGGAAAFAAGGVAMAIVSLGGGEAPTGAAHSLTQLALTLFVLPFQCLGAAAPAVGYQDLRLHREGADVDDLVRVFE
jgi:hypothetical protein